MALRVPASALSLGWIIPAWLGFSELLNVMGRRHSFTEDELAVACQCIYCARSWFLLAAGAWALVACRAALRFLLRRRTHTQRPASV